MQCGGTSEAKPATKEINEIANKVKEQVVSKTNRSYDQFVAVSYKTQVVAGVNYFIKVKVGPSDYIHIRVFQPLPPDNNKFELAAVQENKTELDELEYFA